MAIYSYVTKDISGQYHKGEIETTSENQASNLLRRKKLIVISLKPKVKSKGKFLDKYLFRVSFSEVVVFTRQLATMVQAGLVLSEAVDLLTEQQENKRFKAALEEVSSDIKGGGDFAAALEKHPDIFPDLYCKLIQAGQASGKLDTIMLDLASNLEKQRDFQNRVKGAMIYPVVVILLMFGVMMVMVFFVMPKLLSLYSESQMELPLPTKIVLGVTHFFINFWWAIFGLLILEAVAVKKYASTPEGGVLIDKIMLKAPILGKVMNSVILTNFTRTFSLLIASGLSILDSIKIVSDVTGNRLYKSSLEIVYKGVERGLPFSTQLLGLPIFPRIVGQMARTGEETGKLDEVMGKLATYFEEESDNALKNITTLIEPVILVILGVGVGFLVIAVILPIYQLTTNIK